MRLAAARPAVDELAAEASAAEAESEAIGGRLALLDRLVVPDGVAELAAEVAEADRVRRRCVELDAEAADAVTAAEADLAELPARAPARCGHRRTTCVGPSSTELVERGEVAEAEAQTAVERAPTRSASASAAHEAAAAERERVRVALRARALVPELVAGEPCPVCAQRVETLPDHAPAADLAVADRTVADAERALGKARDAAAAAHTEQARVDEKLAGVRDELTQVAERLADAPDVGRLEEDIARVDGGRERARQGAPGRARRPQDRGRRDAGSTRRSWPERSRPAVRSTTARDAVAALAPPPAERRDLAADWVALVAWAAETAPELSEQLAAQRRIVDDRRREAATARAPSSWPPARPPAWRCRRGGRARRSPLPTPGPRPRSPASTSSSPTPSACATEQRSAVERQQVADLLATHLAANRFEKWLLDEALHQLVAARVDAARRADRRRLRAGGRRRGRAGSSSSTTPTPTQVRSARTLSGGETFLASLALALALADQVAGAGRPAARPASSRSSSTRASARSTPTRSTSVASAPSRSWARGAAWSGVVTHVPRAGRAAAGALRGRQGRRLGRGRAGGGVR